MDFRSYDVEFAMTSLRTYVLALCCVALFSMEAAAQSTFYRASILDFVDDPRRAGVMESYRYFEDGLLVVKDGHVQAVGSYDELEGMIDRTSRVHDYSGYLIMPGFIDTHIHYPQTEMIAAYGEQLLEWLEKYTFPTEKKYADPVYARERSVFFLNELLRNGTTTALVFGTVHPQSVDVLFEEAMNLNMRIIAGKVMMDRHAPEWLLDTATSAYDDSRYLIEKWHGRGRLLYAVTPRFAPTSTPEQLERAGALKREFPDVYVHTHLSENRDEIQWVRSLYPDRIDYLDVYDYHGLTSSRSVFAHGIYLSGRELKVLSETQSAIAFCPTSNLFLGSGPFPLHLVKAQDIKVGMGTDVGAGTSFSMLQTLSEAYKVLQLQQEKFSALEAFYQATLGGAKSLDMADKVGSFRDGHEADFVVIDWAATPLQRLRMTLAETLEEKLFALMILGDDRNIVATHVMGQKLFPNDEL